MINKQTLNIIYANVAKTDTKKVIEETGRK